MLVESQQDAKILIEHGADVNAKNKAGKTPLELCKTDEMRALFAPTLPLDVLHLLSGTRLLMCAPS